MNFVQSFLILGVAGSTLAGSPAVCEPFRSSFLVFENAWINMVDSIEGYVRNSSAAYPVFTPAFVKDLICESRQSLTFAASAITKMSGIDSDVIQKFLNGTEQSLESPLGCIENDLIFMRDKISTILGEVVEELEKSIVDPTNQSKSCFGVYTLMVSYIGPSLNLVTSKGSIIASFTRTFASINMADLYLQSLPVDCLGDIVATAVGSLFKSNTTSLIKYLEDGTTKLQYPYSCAQQLIEIMRKVMIILKSDIITGRPLNLEVPKIPNFFG